MMRSINDETLSLYKDSKIRNIPFSQTLFKKVYEKYKRGDFVVNDYFVVFE